MNFITPDETTDTHDNGTVLPDMLAGIDRGEWVLPLNYPVFHDDGSVSCSCGNASCKKPGNHPDGTLAPNGYHDATNDPDVVYRWIERNPNINWGIALKGSGYLDVAPDSPRWHEIFMERGLPPTLTVQSGGGEGHVHYFFRRPPGCPKTRICVTNEYDIMSDGYATGPGSMHRSARRYEVINDAPVAECPEWAVEELKEKMARSIALDEPIDFSEPPVNLSGAPLQRWRGEKYIQKPDGTIDRSAHLTRVAIDLAQGGATRRTIYDAMRDCDARFWPEPKFLRRRDADRRFTELADEAIRRASQSRSVTSQKEPQPQTLVALLGTHFQDPSWLVPGILVEGLGLLVAPPKVGKSWFALDLGASTAVGRHFLGRDTSPGAVLYLGLEDNPRRLQRRAIDVLGDDVMHMDRLARFHYETDWPRLDEGGLDAIRRWLDEHLDARLVVIDTLAKFRPQSKRNGRLYDEDYSALASLQHLAGERGITILIIHHTRKMADDDVLNTVSGTTGLTGAADAILIMKRARFSDDAILSVIGRDIENEAEYAMRWHQETTRWALVGDAATVELTKTQETLLKVFREVGGWIKAGEIADRAGLKASAVRNHCWRLVKEGALESDRSRGYRLIRDPLYTHDKGRERDIDDNHDIRDKRDMCDKASMSGHAVG